MGETGSGANVVAAYKRITDRIAEAALQAGRELSEITLVAVTKGHPLDHVLPAYRAGARDFGESRIQEALPKIENAPNDLRWHLVGSLQTNKVTKVVGNFSLVHSVDSPRLAQALSNASQAKGVTTEVLLQVNISREASKHGLSEEEVEPFLEFARGLPGIAVKGFMTMAPKEAVESEVRGCFSGLRELRDRLQQAMGSTLPFLSMGMSNDFSLAIAEGSTHLRIGTAIFSAP